MLLDKGADLNEEKSNGIYTRWTPLHAASQNRSYEIVKLLLDKGAEGLILISEAVTSSTKLFKR